MNDGGATSSALGNMLGGIAANLGPEAAAKAQLLREQTEQADWNNRLLSSQVPATENAAGSATGLMTGYGAEPPAPAAGAGSVAGTLATVAQPPTINAGQAGMGFGGRGVVNTSGMSPQDQLVANEILAGRGVGAVTSLAPLGQQAAGGPANVYGVQSDLFRQQHAPVSVSSGVSHYIDPTKGDVPGNVISGGDAATLQAEQKQRALDIDDANQKASLGANAAANLQELQRLNQVYDQIVNAPGTDDTLGAVSDEGLKFLSDKFGANFTKLSPRMQAIQAIQSRMKAMLGSTVASIQGDTPIRGILSSALQSLPDPGALAPDQYRGAVGQLTRQLQLQADLGAPASEFLSSDKSKAAADAYRAKLGGVQAQHAADFKAEMDAAAAKTGPAAPTPPAAPAASMRPATPGEIAEARAGVQQLPKGFTPPQWRDRIIQHARSQGIDLGNF